ncbi:MAG: aspartoacylase [Woronichinia naegeliana WA131]|jgi:succinylglutamate desuccinylase|uniref:Probable aspartoacylase n=1 Tax=Woronichinia naegeliana WA131 TaxID=2824559 RepID=A0A977KTX8_9CYAN|nr:MAG: aspartoacylase [Woronichinia naegeliana WA131]
MTQIPKQIKQPALFGGIHGNELTGLYLIKKFLKQPHLLDRNTFTALAITGNPKAIEACTRFIDKDLNRCFDIESLESVDETIYEQQRAKEIKDIITSNNVDFILDIHSTTSDVGLSFILINDHPFNLGLAAFISQTKPEVRICSFFEKDQPTSFLNSLSPLGFAIEVGAIAQGVLNFSLFEKTEQLINEILSYIDRWNLGITSQSESVKVYQKLITVNFPINSSNELTAFIHPKIQNFVPIKTGDPLFISFDGEVINYTGTQELYPYLVNEAAYYAYNLAFHLMEKTEVKITL